VAGVDPAKPGGGGGSFLSTPLLRSARVLHQDVGYGNRFGILKVLKKAGEQDDNILYTATSSAGLRPGANAYIYTDSAVRGRKKQASGNTSITSKVSTQVPINDGKCTSVNFTEVKWP